MDVLQLAKDASLFFQQVEPGFVSAAHMVGTTWAAGRAVIELIQKGKELVTFRVTTPDKVTAEPPAPSSAPLEPAKKPRRAASKKLPDVAIIVDITLRTMPMVAGYLDDRKIKAELVIVTNDPGYGRNPIYLPMDDPEKWTEIIREFCDTINGIRYTVGRANYHIFLAAPLPVAFGLGAAWGTIYDATVYHWDPKAQSYYPLIRIDRTIRQGKQTVES